MRHRGLHYAAVVIAGAMCGGANAADAPSWMHAQVGMALPAHDEKTNAVVLFQETILTVLPNGKIKRLEREAVKILRPDGAARGIASFSFDLQNPITSMHAWCIPPSGKDYEVKQKDAIESAVIGVNGSELISDERTKTLRIPESTVGSIIGTEVEYELLPNFLAHDWWFQDTVPVRQARYTLVLPSGWSYQSTWLNHREESPVAVGGNQWHAAVARHCRANGGGTDSARRQRVRHKDLGSDRQLVHRLDHG
jgi:hypothetical protein